MRKLYSKQKTVAKKQKKTGYKSGLLYIYNLFYSNSLAASPTGTANPPTTRVDAALRATYSPTDIPASLAKLLIFLI